MMSPPAMVAREALGSARAWGILSVAGLAGVFVADLFAVPGQTHGTLYVPVVLCAMMTRVPAIVLGVSAAAVALIAAGLWPSPPTAAGLPLTDGLINGLYAAGAVLATGCLALLGLRTHARLAQAHHALAESGARLREQHRLMQIAAEVAHFGAWVVDLPALRITWSDEVARIHGKSPGYSPTLEDALGFYVPEHRPRITERFEACARDATPFDEELQIEAADGRRRWVRAVGQAIRNEAGVIDRVQGAFQDISARKEAEQRLSESLNRFRDLAEAMPLIVWSATPDGAVDFQTRAMIEYSGVSSAELIGEGWLQTLHPDDRAQCRAAWQAALHGGEPYHIEFRIRRHDGVYRWHLTHAVPVRDASGQVIKWYGSATDIHDQKLLEAQSQRLAARLNDMLESITEAFFIIDRDWCFTFLNAQTEQLLGHSREELLGQCIWEVFPEAIGGTFDEHYRQALEDNEAVQFETYCAPWEAWFDVSIYPVDEGLAVYFRNVTQRRLLESRLERSQRLEALGQLTGGLAHDFNNLLTVILGNAELLAESHSADGRQRMLAEMIAGAAQRGADLTQRLLAFARRQPLAPAATDINALLARMDALLRRTLGEHIQIELICPATLWPALVDAVQLENALLNLALNARDAMPEGGRLVIETANIDLDADYAALQVEVEPGPYVLLAVSDTGTGIAAGDLPHVFEPFFSTKAQGKGTGLGLAMVYGFVKQSGGHVVIYSEPDDGTVVKLYLPRAGAGEAPQPPAEVASDDLPRGGETILLVEDDELVRHFARAQLLGFGYQVIEAATGIEALETLRARDDIDLLFTDVVMPGGMSGRQLAEAAVRLRPWVKILYTSGYAENAIVHHGRLDAGVQLLTKPYRRAELARRIREALQG